MKNILVDLIALNLCFLVEKLIEEAIDIFEIKADVELR